MGDASSVTLNVTDLKVRVTSEVERIKIPEEDACESEDTDLVTEEVLFDGCIVVDRVKEVDSLSLFECVSFTR